MHTCTYVHTYIHTYIHTCIHTYIHTYIHTCMHRYIHIYIYTHTRKYTYICIHIQTYKQTNIHNSHAHSGRHVTSRASITRETQTGDAADYRRASPGVSTNESDMLISAWMRDSGTIAFNAASSEVKEPTTDTAAPVASTPSRLMDTVTLRRWEVLREVQ